MPIKNDDDRQRKAERLAAGLGWFSLALGLAQVAAPRKVARLIGVPADEVAEATLRAVGMREMANGMAILAQPGRAAWLWSRVGGDAIDISLLGSTLRNREADKGRVAAAAAAVAGITALDAACARQLRGAEAEEEVVRQSATINRPPDEVYRFWRDFENLPRFMQHLQSVSVLDSGRSRWRTRGPAGLSYQWEAETLADRPGELIAWRSVGDSDVRHTGSVRFQRAPGGRGTEVRVELRYTPPAGGLGKTVARLFGEEPGQQIKDDLRRLKQLMETGEIPVSEGMGIRRPARPAAHPESVKTLAGVQP